MPEQELFFLLYTTETGGYLKVYGKVTLEEFEKIKERREILIPTFGTDFPETVTPFYVVLLDTKADYDFVLRRPR